MSISSIPSAIGRKADRVDGGSAPSSALRQSLAACRSGFFAILFFSFAISLLMLAAPLYMLQIYNRVLTSRSIDTLVVLTLAVVMSLVVLAALDIVRSQVMIRTAAWLDRRLAPALLTAAVASTVRADGRASVQSLRDLATIRGFISSPVLFAFFDAPWMPVFLTIIFMLHWLLGVTALAGAVILLFLAIANEMVTRRDASAAGAMAIADLQKAEIAARNAEVLEAMGMLPAVVGRWQRGRAETDRHQSRAAGRGAVFTSLSKALRLTLQVSILGLGAYLAIENEITPGAIIAASILMTRAVAPAEQAISGWRMAASARLAYLRLRRALADAPERNAAMPLPRPSGRLSVEAATYFFPGVVRPAVRNVTFAVEAGECLGIVGPSAAGKTTLARMLVGNLVPRSGAVRLDGADIARWGADDRGPYLGYLPQDVELFDGTVRENIARMGDGDTESITTAARAAGVHQMILRLPNGYETEIGAGGAALSGGQRQRIGLARAFYGDPSLIVLDEPNANLDQAGEIALAEAIERARDRKATLVLVTHSAALIRHVDKLLVMNDGQVRHFGPRDKVLTNIGAAPRQMAKPSAQSEG